MNMPYFPSLQKPHFNPFNFLFWFLLILAVLMLIITFPRMVRAEELVDMSIISQIESNGNPNAVSPEGAIGTYQITYICLQEYNIMTGAKYTSRDLFKPEINKEIAFWYMLVRIPQMLKHYHKPITLENCLISYNAGISRVLSGKIPKETQNYVLRYKKLAERR